MPSESVGTPAPAVARAPLELGPVEPAKTAEGLVAAASYGDAVAEYLELRRGCGLVDRLWAEQLEIGGEDRGRFLNGMITGDARSLEPGGGRYVFFTSAQGRVLAEARLRALPERLLLELPAGQVEPIAAHLAHYIVADRVELAARPELRALGLVGPAAWPVAARLAPAEPSLDEPWATRRVRWEGRDLVLAREERAGGPAITVYVAEADAAAVAARLLEQVDGLAARPVGFAAAEALRVEAGQARFGADFDAERFPQEVGESDALDFEKGCYLGQEVVARIHYRGKVNHRLAGLRLGGGELPAAASPVTLAGEEVGRSGTAARAGGGGEGIALAVLHRRAETGATVEVAGAAARVVELPFAG